LEDKTIWETAEKPWPKQICWQRYIFGDRIGQEGLAEESGQSIGNIRRWSAEAVPSWPKQRESFESDVRCSAYQKTLEMTSDAIAEANAKLNQEHLEEFSKLRTVASTYFETLLKIIESIQAGKKPPAKAEKTLELLKALGGRCSLVAYSNALRIAIAGERQAAYLDLVDPGILEKEASRQGFLLVDAGVLKGDDTSSLASLTDG
jgi:hypothetical protein